MDPIKIVKVVPTKPAIANGHRQSTGRFGQIIKGALRFGIDVGQDVGAQVGRLWRGRLKGRLSHAAKQDVARSGRLFAQNYRPVVGVDNERYQPGARDSSVRKFVASPVGADGREGAVEDRI